MHKEVCCNCNLPSPFWAGSGPDLFMSQDEPRNTDQASNMAKVEDESCVLASRNATCPAASRLPWQMLQLALPAPATGDKRASGIGPQDARRHRRHLQHQPSQQAPDLRQAQPPAKPRDRLKATSLAIPDSSWEAGRAAEANIGAPKRRGDNTFSVPMQAQPLYWADWSEQARRVQVWMGNAAGAFPAPGNAMGHCQGCSATSFSSVMAMEHRHQNHRPPHRWV